MQTTYSFQGTHLITIMRFISIGIGLIFLYGCSFTKQLPDNIPIDIPSHWQTQANTNKNALGQQSPIHENWLNSFNDAKLLEFSQTALKNNPDLLSSAAQLRSAIEQVHIIGANLWPNVSLNLRQSQTENQRSDIGIVATDIVTRVSSASLSVSWEADIWKKLTQRKKSAVFNHLAQQELYRAAELTLVANVSRAWYHLNSNQLLLDISKQELKALQDTAVLINQNYERGLRSALDVYLSRSDVQLQISRVELAKFDYFESLRAFQVLLGQYPDTKLDFIAALPKFEHVITQTGIPAQLLTRRPDIMSSRYQYQSHIANAKAAHRDRYPSITFSGSIGDSKEKFNQLFDGDDLASSLAGNIIHPLFFAGAFKARAKQALYQAEAAYANLYRTTIRAFQEVENTLDREHILRKQRIASNKAVEYSERGLELALDRYQSGLENYTTVLASQRRLYDAKRNAIMLHNALLQNRINLHLALGGNFDLRENDTPVTLPTILGNQKVNP